MGFAARKKSNEKTADWELFGGLELSHPPQRSTEMMRSNEPFSRVYSPVTKSGEGSVQKTVHCTER